MIILHFSKSKALNPAAFLMILSALLFSMCGEIQMVDRPVSDRTGTSGPYIVVTHNVENLFDADNVAIYDDYKPVDRDGNPQYQPTHVYQKITNIVRLMKQYNEGFGPDILMAVEIESDFTIGNKPNAQAFLQQYASTTLSDMLGSNFDDDIADISSEYLLLKGFWDAGIRDYDVATVEPPVRGNGQPSSVIKNVVFSRLPILHERTKAHDITDARPILEVWIDVDGHELVTFTNHWKSGASNPEIEVVRIQNAEVLRNRIDQLKGENPDVDIIVGGDLNSDYNQIQRYTNMSSTGINTILGSSGDELAVSRKAAYLYNLWYELPAEERKSDNYSNQWGTLMHLIVSPGMYNRNGVSYVDNSFEVGIFSGLNANKYNGYPIRWTNGAGGLGFSDHFPLSMEIVVSDDSGSIEPLNPGVENDASWKPIRLVPVMPPAQEIAVFDASRPESYLTAEHYDSFFEVTGRFNADGTLQVGSMTFDLFSPAFRINQVLESQIQAEETIQFVGRLSNFRNSWQFIIDDRDFIR